MKFVRNRAAIRAAWYRAGIELLESRTLLSAAYVVTDVGLLPGATGSQATAVNASGEVVGTQYLDGQYEGGSYAGWTQFHAFLWSSSQGLLDLGTLPGDSAAVANAINAGGTVVGASGSAGLLAPFINQYTGLLDISDSHAFLWTAGGGMRDLGVLPGYTGSDANGINSAGEVVGTCTTDNGGEQAFVWTSAGGMKALAGATPSTANAINDAGQIAGEANLSPTLWSASGQMQTLVNDGAGGGGANGSANAINTAGEVAGANASMSATTGLNVTSSAALWTDPSTRQSLGLIPGQTQVSSLALGVNDSGVVVGSGFDSPDYENSYPGGGFVWTASSGLQDLNTLVKPGVGIISASGINNSGLIAASASLTAYGTTQACLLTPAASAPATQLVFTLQPFSAAAGQPILPFSVAVEDQDGNILAADNSSVTLSLGSTAGGMLNGALSTPAKNGVATFSSISVSAEGEYTLRATDAGDGTAVSSYFDITVAPTGAAAATVTLSSTDIAPQSEMSANSLTATVAPAVAGGAAPGGVVVFYENGVPFASPVLDNAGSASVLTYNLALPFGSDSITAAYSGDQNYQPAMSQPLIETVSNPSGNAVFLSGKIPQSVIAGQKIAIAQSIQITNNGTAAYQGLESIRFFLSPTVKLDSGAIELPQTVSRNLKLAKGKSAKLKLSIKALPATVPAGTYYLVDEATDAEGNTDIDFANATNSSNDKISIEAPTIDLSGAFARKFPAFKSGAKSTIALVVSNSGNSPATGELSVALDALVDGMLDQNAVTITTRPVHISIKSGKSATIHLTSLILPAGSYVLSATLDPNNAFGDANTSNNTFVSGQVTVA